MHMNIRLLVAIAVAVLLGAHTWAAAQQLAASASSASASSASAATASASEALPRVTVSARRAEIQPRVFHFVSQVSALDGGGGLARWQVPVCPSVTGLSRVEGEFVLERLSEIARAAKVPLAAETCSHPNLFIWVTTDPTKLLEAMRRRRRQATFGDADPNIVDAFIAAPLAAKVWYDSLMETAGNVRPIYGSINGVVGGLLTGMKINQNGEGTSLLGGSGIGTGNGSQGGSGGVTTDFERASRVERTMVWAFSTVYVIVDQKRLQGVTRQQLADYAGMVGLAEINPGAQLGEAPTILKLFDGPPQAALPAMSDWDQSFLKSLYLVDQDVKVQQGEIALDMVREIVP